MHNYRSALVAIHYGFDDGSFISDNSVIHHLLWSMFITHPQVKHLVLLWDLGEVFRLLAGSPFEPLADVSYLHLSIKLAFLLAVTTSQYGASFTPCLFISKGNLTVCAWSRQLASSPKIQTPTFHLPDILVPDLASSNR